MLKKINFFAIVALISLFLFLGKESKALDTFPPEVKIFNISNLNLQKNFFAFDVGFRGGVNLATCDLTGDGIDEIVVGAGQGGGPHVRIFDLNGNYLGRDFFPFRLDFRGGVNVACGDVDGDKTNELIFAQSSSGQAWVKVYENDKAKTIISNFLAYAPDFQGGVNIAAGDVNGDGKDEIITGPGVGGGPHVRVFNQYGQFLGLDFWPFREDFRGGVSVASGNVDGGKEDEIIVAQNSLGQAWVKVYKTNHERTILGEFLAFSPTHLGGAWVSSGDINHDGRDEVIVASGARGGPHIRVFEASGKPLSLNFFAYPSDFRGGVKIAFGKFKNEKGIIAGPGRLVFERARYPYYKYIEINLSQQSLKYFEGGRKVDEFLISSGRSGWRTPTGIFRIQRKVLAELMAGPGYYLPAVPYVMGFLGSYTIHGTYWHNNFGHPMSHGCINAPTPKARELYFWADIGTPVVIHY
jgi:hypothetical protein